MDLCIGDACILCLYFCLFIISFSLLFQRVYQYKLSCPQDATVQPALIIVYFGGNDSMQAHPSGLGPHVPLEEYKENMRVIGNHLKVSFPRTKLSNLFRYFFQCSSFTVYCYLQSLSETTRIIFLTCPPLNEERLRQNTRCFNSLGSYKLYKTILSISNSGFQGLPVF